MFLKISHYAFICRNISSQRHERKSLQLLLKGLFQLCMQPEIQRTKFSKAFLQQEFFLTTEVYCTFNLHVLFTSKSYFNLLNYILQTQQTIWNSLISSCSRDMVTTPKPDAVIYIKHLKTLTLSSRVWSLQLLSRFKRFQGPRKKAF